MLRKSRKERRKNEQKRDFKISLIFLFGGVGLFLSGCGSGSIAEEERSTSSLIKPRFGLEVTRWEVKELGEKIQTTQVHPDDSGFLTGETTTDLEGKKEWDGAPKIGLVRLIGDDNLRLKIGADIRYNILSHQYHEGLYDWRQQVSDTRPPSQGSFVFTQLIPGHLTYIPFVGIEKELSESVFLSFEFGFPYMEWEARSGHDRWGKWQTVQEDSWRGFGQRYTCTLGFKEFGNGELFVSGFYEQYKPDFVGEGAKVDCYGVLIGMKFRF